MEEVIRRAVPVHSLIHKRHSPRGFAPGNISGEQIEILLEAARLAPSSFNEQPWRFLVATRENREAFDRFLGILMEKNREWAQTASALILTVAKTEFSHNGAPNRHSWYDVGQAVASLTLQATELGLAVHQMAGYDREMAREVFNIPAGYEPVSVIAIGHAPSQPSGGHIRRPVSEIAFGPEWGKPFSTREMASSRVFRPVSAPSVPRG